MMGVFNNLIEFDQHNPRNSLQSIVPDLATGWSWSEDGTDLTFPLRQGVKWHDGQPFTAADVKCSWELRLGTAPQKLRLDFQKSALYNVASITTNGDYEVTFHLKRPQPAFPMILAGGFAVVTPCHLSPEQLRQHPIGTGPFKFVEFNPGQDIKVTRNPDYWKPGRPYLDGIEYTIIPDPATADLAFVSGQGRHDLSLYAVGAAVQRRARAGPGSGLRAGADHQPPPARQPRKTALRRPRAAEGDGAQHRPRGVCRDPDPGEGRQSAAPCSRRRRARGACRPTRSPSCPAMVPMSISIAKKPARSCESSATGRTSRSTSR